MGWQNGPPKSICFPSIFRSHTIEGKKRSLIIGNLVLYLLIRGIKVKHNLAYPAKVWHGTFSIPVWHKTCTISNQIFAWDIYHI